MRENQSKGIHDEKVHEEDQRARAAEQIIRNLELKEQAIIERLKHTQVTESDARNQLIEAILITSKGKKERLSVGD